MTTPAAQKAQDEIPKVWQINLNGSSVKVEDLPLEVVDRVAKAQNTSWFVVVNSPLTDLALALALLQEAAAHLGVDAPEQPTVKDLVHLVTLEPDTVPEPPPVEADPFVPSGTATETPGS